MCGRSIARRSRFGAKGAREPRLFGADVENMSPGGRVAAAMAVIVPVALSGVFLVAFFPEIWWVFTIYGWAMFPAFGVLARGAAGLSEGRVKSASMTSPERELLEALQRHGELTPARAAMETSLSVSEADKMLGELAGDGHLEVRVHDGGVFYALWRAEVEAS